MIPVATANDESRRRGSLPTAQRVKGAPIRDCSVLRSILLAAVVACFPFTASAAPQEDAATDPPAPVPVRVAPRVLHPAPAPIGERIPDLALLDVDGKRSQLFDFAGSRALVVLMHSLECPLSRKMTPKIARLQAELAETGAGLLLLNPVEGVSADDVRAFRSEFDLGDASYGIDREGRIARALGATTTTETFVLDASRTLRYRGAFDDQYGLGYSLAEPRSEPLRDAIRAVLARRLPQVEATTAPGCELDLAASPDAAAAGAKPPAITYHGRVSRILQRNCQSCHRDGESAPFALSSYEDAKRMKGMMRYVLANRQMPPWFAVDAEHPFGNAPAMTDRDRDDVLAWIEAGCPEGDEADAVTPIEWTDGWQIGEPDLVVTVPRVFRVPAEGTIDYQYARVRLPIERDRWVRAMEIRPSAPEVVHHVLVLVQYPRRHEKDLVQPDFQDGIGGYFAVMVPGQTTNVFPEGTAKFLPRGSSLIFQIHYTATGKEAVDQPRMAFRFAEGEPEREMQTRGVANVRFRIPPGDPRHEVRAAHRFENDVEVFGFFPHMHLRGTAFRYRLRYPDGREEMLLDIPRYDFNWQLYYRLHEPLVVPEGAILEVTGWFDNSADNPANPDPKKTVRFGEQTWEEMMIGYFDWAPIP